MNKLYLVPLLMLFCMFKADAQQFGKSGKKLPVQYPSASAQSRPSAASVNQPNAVAALVLNCPAAISVCGSQSVTYSLPVASGGDYPQVARQLTQTTSNTITPSNSVSCNNGTGHTANSYYRVFDLAAMSVTGPYTVRKVTIGVEQATSPGGSQPATIKVHSLTGAFTMANLTLLSTENITIANQSGTLIETTLTTPAVIPANGKLVLEVFTPEGRPTSSMFLMGSNTAGQSAPNYISAPDCGVLNPVKVADVGYPNMHAVLFADGEAGPVPAPPVLTAGLASGAVFPVGTTVNTYTVTDGSGTSTSCSFNVVVNPVPDVTATANQSFCNNTATTAITFAGAVAGTSFSWTNNNTAIGLPANGTGNIGSFTAINTTSTAITATITVTPSYTNGSTTCTGSPKTFTITVNPSPSVNTVDNVALCSGATSAAIAFTGNPAGTVYNWVNNTPSIGLAAYGTGNIPAFTASNSTADPLVATVTVTPSFTAGGNTCAGTAATFEITVKAVPVADPVSNKIICNGATSPAISLTSESAGTVFNWTNNNPSIGLAASGTGNIPSFTATNSGTAPVKATITVVPTTSESGAAGTETFNYTGSIQTFTVPAGVTSLHITASGAAGGTVTSNGGPFAGGKGATMSGDFAVTPGQVLQLVVGGKGKNDPSSSGGGGGTGVNASGVALIVAGGGAGIDFQQPNYTGRNAVTTVNGQPGSNNSTSAGTAGGNGGNMTYSGNTSYGGKGWNAGNSGSTGGNGISSSTSTTVGTWGLGGGGGSVGLGYCNCGGGGGGYSGGGSGSINASGGGGGSINTGANQVNTAGANAGDGVIVITYGSVSTCTGDPVTFDITVNPTATVNTVSNQVVCPNNNTTAVTFSSPATGGTVEYNWVNNTASIGLASSGTGNIPAFTATNATTAPVTATITVTPSYTNGGITCTGTPATFTITVNPAAAVTTVANQTICNNGNTTAVNFGSTATGGSIVYNWTNNMPSIGLAASGTGNIASFTGTNTTTAPVTATITVTLSYTNGSVTCTGMATTFTITVNPAATVNTIASQVVCNNSNTTAIAFNSAATGGTVVYNWTNNTPSIGLAASGSGNIASFTAINATATPVTATITVTPSYTNGGATCTGTATTFEITVNPAPATNAVANQVICNNANTTAVAFSSTATGGAIVYNWTNNTPGIGLAASGTGNIASFIGTNTTSAPLTATITVTASYTNGSATCNGIPTTFTITVNPTATVNAVTDKTVCNNATNAAIAFSSTATGGTIVYSWTNNNTSIGLAAAGTGTIAAFTATNTTTAPVTATITVTPTYTNGGATCTGTPRTFTISVNPTPVVNAVSNQLVCNGAPVNAVPFGSTATGGTIVYNWTNNTPSIGLAATGTGDIASFNAVNNGTAPVTATITVKASFTNTATCAGPDRTFTITVNPTATVTAVSNQVLCTNNNTAAVNFTSPVTGGTIVYNWTNNNTSIGLAAGGTGNIPSFTAVNNGSAAVTATVIVTPVFTNGGISCTGTPYTFTVTVNALSTAPTAAVASKQLVCGSGTVNLSATGGTLGTGAVYKWYSGSCGGFLVGTGATLNNVPVNGTTTFYVRIEGTCNTTSCVSTTVTGGPSIDVVLTPTPSSSTTPGINTVLYTTISPAGNYTYQWTRNGNTISNATDKLRVTADVPGIYKVRVTSPEGCSFESNAVTISDSAVEKQMFITPNPNDGRFKVAVYATAAEVGTGRTLHVYDARGGKVLTKPYMVTTSYDFVDLDLRNKTKGIYFIKIMDSKGKVISTGRAMTGSY